MIPTTAVTIVLNGSVVASVMPARIAGGRVVAPVSPVVVQLGSRVAYDSATGTITIERSSLRIVVPVAFTENDVPFVALGPVVHGLGGSATFDRRTKTLAIVLRTDSAIATPIPFDPHAPRAEPTVIFTPAPPAPTPRALETGIPRPRRTAIPVMPSQPVVSPDADAGGRPTTPRR